MSLSETADLLTYQMTAALRQLLTGNGNKVLRVNSGGNGFQVTDVTTTQSANKIAMTGSGGKIDALVSDADATTPGKIQLAGDLSGTATSPTVVSATTSVAGKVQLAVDGGVTAGTVVQANDTRLSGGVVSAGPTALASYCGAGGSGNVAFDGSTSVTGWLLSGGVYTATSAAILDYDTVTLSAGVTLVPKGCVLKMRRLLGSGSGTAYILATGGDGSGLTAGSGGAVLASQRLIGGGNGGNGRSTVNPGVAGTGVTTGISLGGAGGAGATAGGGNTGGAGGALTRNWNVGSTYGDAASFLLNVGGFSMTTGTGTFYGIAGGGGGGSGGCNATGGPSGGGGGGGGALAVYAASASLGSVTLVLSSAGGRGADAAAANAGNIDGGGGGGGGGFAGFLVGYLSGSVQLIASGGGGGAGAFKAAATGAFGGNGGDGGVAICLYGTLAAGTSVPTVTAAAGAAGAAAGTGSPGSAGAAGITLALAA